MKCLNCGCVNPADNKFCSNCGAPLNAEAQGEKTSSGGAVWGFMKNDAEGNPGGAVRSDDFETDPEFDNADIDELELMFTDGVDEWQPTTAAGQRDRARKQEQARAADKTNRRQEPQRGEKPARKPGAVFDDANKYAESISQKEQKPAETARKKPASESRAANTKRKPEPVDDYDDYQGSAKRIKPIERSAQKRGSTGGALKVVALIAIIAAIGVVIGIIIHVLKGGIFPNRPAKQAGEITVNPNNPSEYIITIYAKAGSKVVYEFSNGQQTDDFEVSSRNSVTFRVAARDLIPVEPIEGETCEATPKAYLRAEDGSLTPLDMPSITVNVPKLSISFDNADSFTAENGTVVISGHIAAEQRAAQLTVDDRPLTVNEDGSFSYTDKRDKGEYDINFTASLGGYMIEHKTFRVTVEKQLTADEIVVIPRSFVTRALNAEDTIHVEGKVPVGTTLSVVSDDPGFSLKTQPEIDEAGNFNFVVNLPEASKVYPMTIIATLQDGTVYERPFCVERPPKYNDYVPTVWPDNYDEMIKPNHVTENPPRGFELKGTVGEILRDDDYLVAEFTLDSGHTVIIEYHNHYTQATELTPGEHQEMYAYSLGMDENNVLHLFVWFVKD